MSMFLLCDGEDCYHSENEGVSNVTFEVREYIKDKYRYCFKHTPDDLCSDCVDSLNEVMEDNDTEEYMVEIDSVNDIILIKKKGN